MPALNPATLTPSTVSALNSALLVTSGASSSLMVPMAEPAVALTVAGQGTGPSVPSKMGPSMVTLNVSDCSLWESSKVDTLKVSVVRPAGITTGWSTRGV